MTHQGSSEHFFAFFQTSTLTDQYYKSFSVDATIMVSNRCPIAGKQVMITSCLSNGINCYKHPYFLQKFEVALNLIGKLCQN